MKKQPVTMRPVAEGLVIVISILMAFAIDAWWDGRQIAARRAELVEGLIQDVELSQERLEESRAELGDQLARTDALLRLVGSSPTLPKDSLQHLLQGFFSSTQFLPAVSTYEAALGSGDLALLRSPDFNRTMTDFQQALGFFELSRPVGIRSFYLGPVLELRRRVGSLGVFVNDRGLDCGGYEWCYPPAFELTPDAIQRTVLDPDVFGLLESSRNLKLNQFEQFETMGEALARLLEVLEAIEAATLVR